VVDEAVTIPVSTFVRHDDATWLETWTRHQKSAPSPEECLMEVLVFAPSSSGGTESATLDSDGSGVGAGVGATDVDTDVVLVCNHAFCDGISLSWVAHELLLVLGDGAELAPLPLPPAIETCAHRSIGNAFMRMFAMVKLGMTMGKPTPCAMFPVSDKSIPFLELHATADTVTLYADLDVTNTAALSAACRSHGVTITAAVWAALVQAVEVLVSEAHDLDDMDERGAPLPIRVHCGADTRRRYVPALAPNLLSYHVAGVPTPKVVFGDEEGEALRSPAGLWTLAARAKSLWTQALQKGLTNAFCLVLGRMYSAALQLTVRAPCSACLACRGRGTHVRRGGSCGLVVCVRSVCCPRITCRGPIQAPAVCRAGACSHSSSSTGIGSSWTRDPVSTWRTSAPPSRLRQR